SLDPGAVAEDAVLADPTVDPATVVPNLKAFSLDRLHQMQVLLAVHLAQHDVAYLEGRRRHRLDRTQLAGFDLSLHGVPPGAELNRCTISQTGDIIRSPFHFVSFQRSRANSLALRNWPSLTKCLRRKPSSLKPHFSRTQAEAG